MEKREVRKETKELILAIPEKERILRSDKIQERVLSLRELREASVVACYVALPFEVQTERIMRNVLSRGRKIVLPRTNWDAGSMEMIEVVDLDTDLVGGPKQIIEPRGENAVSPEKIDFVVVPGRAFDKSCNRVGQGGGFYDRFLKELPPACVTCGVGYEVQVLDFVPVGEHDVPVDIVVSEDVSLRSLGRDHHCGVNS